MFFDLCYARDFPVLQRDNAGGVEEWWRRTTEKIKWSKLANEDMEALNILAMAACYSPDARRRGIGLPMDLHTCERISEVWARQLEWDPTSCSTATSRACAGCACST
jgi:hypothetical protein